MHRRIAADCSRRQRVHSGLVLWPSNTVVVGHIGQ
jgi:hypothetical protein